MNKVILMGRLTRDPEIRQSQNGDITLTIARFVLAVDRRRTGEQNAADFPQVVVFGKPAEFAEKYLKQGTKVVLSGRLQTGSYTDRDGKKVYTTEVVADELEFAESKNASGGTQQNTFAGSFKDSQKPVEDADGFMDIPDSVDDDGLPFH